MKKPILAIFLFFLAISLPQVFSENAVLPDTFTGTSYPHIYQKSLFQLQTVVGGFRCSDNINLHYRTVSGGLPYPANRAVSFLDIRTYRVNVWRWNPWGIVDEIDVIKGQGSITKTYPYEIDYAYFYCDIFQETCKEVSPYTNIGCDFNQCGEGKVLRRRTIQELTSGGCTGWNTQGCYPDTDYDISCRNFCLQVITTACNPLTKQIKDFSSSCIDSGWTTDLSKCPQATPSVSFKLSNLKRISGVKELPSGAGADSPFLYSSYVFGQGEIFSITIKNIGTQSSAPTLEAFFISKDNLFVKSKEENLCITPLQSVFGRVGIENKQLSTCKGDKGAVYTLSSMNPNEEATFYIYVPYPRSQEEGGSPSDYTLAGNLNYNKEKQYFVDISLISGCENPAFYDEIGGTLNYNINNQCTLGSSDANQTTININTRQVTTKKEIIKTAVAGDLQKSLCSSNAECFADATCQSISSLVTEGVLTQKQATENLNTHYQLTANVVGATIGALSGLKIGALFCAPAVAAGGVGYPICLGITSLGGGLAGGLLTDSVGKTFESIKSKDDSKLGYCVSKEETAGGKFIDFIESIGKSLNDAFGGKAKTKLDDITMGYIILGAFFIFIIIAFTKK